MEKPASSCLKTSRGQRFENMRHHVGFNKTAPTVQTTTSLGPDSSTSPAVIVLSAPHSSKYKIRIWPQSGFAHRFNGYGMFQWRLARQLPKISSDIQIESCHKWLRLRNSVTKTYTTQLTALLISLIEEESLETLTSIHHIHFFFSIYLSITLQWARGHLCKGTSQKKSLMRIHPFLSFIASFNKLRLWPWHEVWKRMYVPIPQ